MTLWTYNPNIPAANNRPAADQGPMQNNFLNIGNLINVDHIGFGFNNGGYHTVIHQNQQLSEPPTIASINQLFSMVPSTNLPPTDVQLFSKTGLGTLSQMTGSSVSVSPRQGYFWSAGFLFQFGQVSPMVGASQTNVNFIVPFPNNVFNIQATLNPNGSTSNAQAISVRTRASPNTLSSFVYNYSASSSTNYTGFFWLAIGN